METFLLVLLLLVVVIAIWVVSVYNGLIKLNIRTDEAWSDIDVQLKRRYDLIPNLISTVKGYASHESGVFEKVTEARTRAMGAQTADERGKAENALSGTLKSLFAVAENYPELKANTNFLELQRELSDTENKIQAARRFYNGNVRDLNTKVQVFPNSIIAKMLSIGNRDFFEIEDSNEKSVPKVENKYMIYKIFRPVVFFLLFTFVFLGSVNFTQAKSYKIKVSCSTGTSESFNDPAWPSVVAPVCDENYREYFYADRSSQGTIAKPSDYDSVTSDPWITSVGAEVWYSSTGSTIGCTRGNGTVFECAVRANYVGTSKDFYFRNESGTAISSIHKTSSDSDDRWWYSCAYRICAEMDVCDPDRTDTPDCTVDPDSSVDPYGCLEAPGECAVDSSNNAVCKYSVSQDPCYADCDFCTIDQCVSYDDGITATCESGDVNFCSGLVPCGRMIDDPGTSWNEKQDCKICHIIPMIKNVIDYLIQIVAVIAVLSIILAIVVSMTSIGGFNAMIFIKTAVSKSLLGFVVVFVAWMTVNASMTLFGFSDPLGDGSWQIFNCEVDTSTETCGDGVVNGLEVCDSNTTSCSNFASNGLPSYCSDVVVEGTQQCNSCCTGWGTCNANSLAVNLQGSEYYNADNYIQLPDHSCCEITSCVLNTSVGMGCPTGGAYLQSGYSIVDRTTCGSNKIICALQRSDSNPRNWVLTTQNGKVEYRCWE